MDLDAATVMRPKLVRIGDSCYRRLDVDADGIIDDYTLKGDKRTGQVQSTNVPSKNNDSQKKYNIDELEADDFNDQLPSTGEETEEELVLNEGETLKSDSRGFALRIHVCSVFYPYIIGKRGSTKSSIEGDTRTKLKIPRESENRGSESNFVQIFGNSKSAVLAAKKRIDTLVESFRKKQDITHFVAVPIGTNLEVQQRFEQFKSEVLSDVKCSVSKGIDEAVFQEGPRLHLTLRVLYLGDSYERKQATNILESFKTDFLDDFLKGKPKIQLHIKGLDIMNDDPSEVNVLFAKAQEVGNEDLFKQIVNKLYDCFTPLVKGDKWRAEDNNSEWKVKIHATLMNSRYRDRAQADEAQDQPNGGNKNGDSKFAGQRSKMDVTNILDKFGDFDFGHITLDQIHICIQKCFDEENYYRTLATIAI